MLRPPDDIYALQASILRTLGSPRRLEIVHLLGVEPREVRCLVEALGISQPAVSQHLAAMRSAGLVEPIRDGRDVRYQLTDPGIQQACELMRGVLFRRLGRLGRLAASLGEPEVRTMTPVGARGYDA
jgi:DNA-binding transcriptional ArsR family regulator